jgi:hypothetical protein
MISSNISRYGSVYAALSAYNAGSPTATGTTTDWGDGKPVGYADSVLRHLARLTGGEAPAAATTGATAAASTTAAATGGTEDAGDVNALQALSQQLGSMGGGSTGGGFQLSLPQYQPLAKPDDRDRNLAPSTGGDSDDDT